MSVQDEASGPENGNGPGGKARFYDIYNQADPRAYFTRLAPLGYEIPQHAQPVFRRAAELRSSAGAGAGAGDGGGRRPAVLDVCCSYGINAALLNHDLTMAELYEHYTGRRAQRLSTVELAAWDKEFYEERRRPDAYPVIGLDIAARAVRYAQAVGLLDAACTDNLELEPPGPRLSAALADVGLITMTGGGSYITERTFDALLSGAGRPVWVSAFWLRTVPFAPIAETLAAHGLRTTADTARTYPQRRFTDEREQRYAVAAVRALGEDPSGLEEAGLFQTVLYESRP
ncbi:hypothetical protein E6W39_07540 [Kitasatospora acidiphila]|uniref:Methyltransferase type 12 n=1 Tax=Kitasatospora acidiphila TaxID=2567942 RepID=A0A540VZG2_9ACTN|nr:hypothetical protein [Kitasatospora acidiphila]TQF02155.1 hypothetical protein E6W39_07540 [Kitasatospora acidiphila]